MSGIAEAKARARRLYPKSASFQGTYEDGATAAIAGRLRESCPHADGAGWRRPRRRAWLRGFDSINKED